MDQTITNASHFFTKRNLALVSLLLVLIAIAPFLYSYFSTGKSPFAPKILTPLTPFPTYPPYKKSEVNTILEQNAKAIQGTMDQLDKDSKVVDTLKQTIANSK